MLKILICPKHLRARGTIFIAFNLSIKTPASVNTATSWTFGQKGLCPDIYQHMRIRSEKFHQIIAFCVKIQYGYI
jgi:hypothetical protein